MTGQDVEVMTAGDETRLLLNAETSEMTVHRDVISEMTVHHGVISEMMGLVDKAVMIAGQEMRGLHQVAGTDTGRTETGEVTAEFVMMQEAAGDAVVVLMRVIAGLEVQTQDVMEDELAEEMTSVDVVEIEMISADETIEEMIEILVIEDVMIEASEAAEMIEGMCYTYTCINLPDVCRLHANSFNIDTHSKAVGAGCCTRWGLPVD